MFQAQQRTGDSFSSHGGEGAHGFSGLGSETKVVFKDAKIKEVCSDGDVPRGIDHLSRSEVPQAAS